MSVRVINDAKSRVWVRPASDNNNLVLDEYGDLVSYSALKNNANDNFNRYVSLSLPPPVSLSLRPLSRALFAL